MNIIQRTKENNFHKIICNGEIDGCPFSNAQLYL